MHPKDILRDEKSPLQNSTSPSYNDSFKAKKISSDGWILKFFKKSLKLHLTASLPDHIHKPRRQTKHRTAAILRHNNKLTNEMRLLGFR